MIRASNQSCLERDCKGSEHKLLVMQWTEIVISMVDMVEEELTMVVIEE